MNKRNEGGGIQILTVFYLFISILCAFVFYLCVCLCTSCMQQPWRLEEGIRMYRIRSKMVMSHHVSAKSQIWILWGKCLTLLTSESSLLPILFWNERNAIGMATLTIKDYLCSGEYMLVAGDGLFCWPKMLELPGINRKVSLAKSLKLYSLSVEY